MIASLILAQEDGLLKMARDTGEQFGVTLPLFIAQLISFSIVAFFLHRFAYKPILTVLDERKKRIAEGLANAEKIKKELAAAEVRYQEILSKANEDAQRIIDEARSATASIAEKGKQEAIAEAQHIIAKAREATEVEHAQMFSSLKRELGRLVIDTTSRVTGKILTPEDQARLSEEATRQAVA